MRLRPWDSLALERPTSSAAPPSCCAFVVIEALDKVLGDLDSFSVAERDDLEPALVPIERFGGAEKRSL